MKKICLITLLLLGSIFASSQVQAQAPVRKNIVKINPLSLGILTVNAAYEKVVSDMTTIQLGVFYSGFNLGDTYFNGIGITPEVRMYLSGVKEAPEGFHISPFLRYQNFSLSTSPNEEEEKVKGKLSSYGGGIVFGYQWLLGKNDRISLDLFAGPKYGKSKFVAESTAEEDDFDELDKFGGVSIRSGLTLGVAF